MRNGRGYSLVELLVVVAMIGIVALVTLPALMQLMPQYRIRGAASEAAGAIRMVRQRAITTRTPWRISFDATNDRYRFWTLTSPYADMSVATNWRAIRRDGRTPDPLGEDWFRSPPVDLNAATDTFNDVACPADGALDLIFLRDGSVAPNAPCTGPSSDVLTFSPNPGVVFAVDSSVVRFNRYYVSVSQTGLVEVRAAKE
ncbi:MAG TPA: GspH/FimT family pseudopilin [Thermoanaerobaculia bacterium]